MTEGINPTFINTHEDKYTFLSCGESYREPPDFSALFMPFSKTTWSLIFITIFGWPLVLSLIENDFKLKHVLKDLDALFIGWAIILEQSPLRAGNYKGRRALYCYCGCVLLVIPILSNAYKGDNIKTLTKSFEVIPLTQMSQLINAGYKTYSAMGCLGTWIPNLLEMLEKGSGLDACLNEFDYQSEARRNQFTDEQFKLWKPMGYKIKDSFEYVKEEIDFLKKCQKTAFLDWRSVLEPLEKLLLEKHNKPKVNVGQEFLFAQSAGWRLKRYGSIKVLKRMWTIVESGIHNKLRNISYKPPVRTGYKPQKVEIDGNIFVQFVFHLFGLLFALLVFIAEFHKRINSFFNPVRVTVSLLNRNFLKQAQKAFLIGLKICVRGRKYFIDYYRQQCFKLSLLFTKRTSIH